MVDLHAEGVPLTTLLLELAAVADELRQHLWADDRHMAAGVAAEADVVALTLPKP